MVQNSERHAPRLSTPPVSPHPRRPGELAGTCWRDYDAKAHVLTIGDAKAGNTIEIPTTPEIEAAIKMAATDLTIIYKSHGRDFVHKKTVARGPDDFIFAGCQFIQARNRSELPAIGHALRRTYKTIATDHCGVPDDISAALQAMCRKACRKSI